MKTLAVNRTTAISWAAVFVVFAFGAFFASRAQAKTTAKPDTSHIVELTTSGAKPSAIAITKGDYVQFDTKDGRTHEIAQGKGGGEGHHTDGQGKHEHLSGGKLSAGFGPGEGYKVQFNQTGTYDFHDHLNPELSSTVIVYEAGAAPTSFVR